MALFFYTLAEKKKEVEVLIFVFGLALGSVVAFVLLNKIRKQSEGLLNGQLEESKNQRDRLTEELKQERETLSIKKQELAVAETNIKNLEAKFIEEAKVLETRFENLANRILEEKSKKFTEQNKSNLSDLLNPLKERIITFEQKVEKSNKDSLEWNATLKEQITALKQSNLQITQEAQNLTKALTGDSKVQGDWGELQLELLLEKAGLEKEVHFSTQSAIRDDDGNLKRPDFVINLPEGKHLIIDSKVSLTAYERYAKEEDEEQKAKYLKLHLGSIREMIKDLSEKNYQDLYGLNTPDYVMMFIPIEPAFHLAVQKDDLLYNFALEKNIVLVTTSTLLAVMRTIAYIWRQDKQTKNVLEIARVGGTLYDKFVGFTEDLIKVGKSFETTKTAYQDAMSKLTEGSGNLVGQTEKLIKLGAKAKKSINPKLLDRSSNEG